MDVEGAGRAPVFPVPQQQAPSSTLLFQTPSAPYYYYYSPSSSSPATSSRLTHHVSLSLTSLPILVLTVLGILTTSALLLTYYVFVIRCCLTWHATSSDHDSGASRSLVISLTRRRRSRSSAAFDHELPVVHGPEPDEARGGLGEPAIQALPAFRYSKAAKDGATGGDGSECAVCLGEFQEGERVRLLPSCLHVFHAECIDTWLQGCANCPLCRAAITGKQTWLMTDQLPQTEEVVIEVLSPEPENKAHEHSSKKPTRRPRRTIVTSMEIVAAAALEHIVGSEKAEQKGNKLRMMEEQWPRNRNFRGKTKKNMKSEKEKWWRQHLCDYDGGATRAPGLELRGESLGLTRVGYTWQW